MREYRERKRKQAPAYQVGEICKYAETLRIPTGLLQGQHFALQSFQRRFLERALEKGVREAVLCTARKNGKTALIAILLLYYLLEGAKTNWRALVVSLTGALAAELRMQIQQIAEANGLMDELQFRISPQPGYVTGREGARVDFLNADRSSGHAVGADLAIFDESGLLPARKRHLWSAVYSATSGRQDSRVLHISVRGDSEMFEELRQRRDSEHVYWQEHAAPKSAAIDDVEGWYAANPALESGFKSMEYLEVACERAKSSPSNAPAFEAYDLNRPAQPDLQPIVTVSQWQQCIVDELPERRGPLHIGLDLGGALSLCAMAFYWSETGRFEIYAGLPSEPNPVERARNEVLPDDTYTSMRDRGELRLYSGKVTPVEPFIKDCMDRLEGYPIAALGCDRFRKEQLEVALANLDLSTVNLIKRGTGAHAKAEGSHDVREFQTRVANGEIKALESLLMAQAIAESALRFDGGGNPALSKARQNARIDALQAAVIAVGTAYAQAATRPQLLVI